MKRSTIAMSLLTACLASFSFAETILTTPTTAAAPAVVPAQAMSILFVQTAQTGTLSSSTLTLNQVSKHTLWFSDRPVRKYGTIDTDAFVQQWNQGMGQQSFKQVPPNAAIVDASVQHKTGDSIQMLPMILSQPTYDASTGTLTYQIKFLDPQNMPTQPKTLQDISVFIDGLVIPDYGNSYRGVK